MVPSHVQVYACDGVYVYVWEWDYREKERECDTVCVCLNYIVYSINVGVFGYVICLFGFWKNNAASFCVFVEKNSVESGVQLLARSPKPQTQTTNIIKSLNYNYLFHFITHYLLFKSQFNFHFFWRPSPPPTKHFCGQLSPNSLHFFGVPVF